jgi:AraC-like DNA-binding protein
MSGWVLKAQDWETMAREANFRPSCVAAKCFISLRQLERHFANHFHKTPGAWSRELRCRMAQQLLSQGWSNKAVAADLGFTDSPHLCREFRKMYGMTPYLAAPVHAPLNRAKV